MGFFDEISEFVSDPIGYIQEDIAQPFEEAVIRPIGGAIEDGLDKVFTVIDGVMSDPKKLVMIGLMVAFPGAAAAIGNALLPASLAGSAAATFIGNTVLNTITNGGKIEEALKGAVIGSAAQGLTGELQSAFGPTQDAVSILGDANVDLVAKNMETALANIAAKTTSDAAIATVLGKDPTAALVFGGASAAANAITNQVFESAGIKDDFDKLPTAAKNSLNAALVASLSGKDAGDAAVNTLVNNAIRTFQNGITLQDKSIKASGAPLDEQRLRTLASTEGITPSNAGSFLATVDAAENLYGTNVPLEAIANISTPYSDKPASENAIIQAIVDSKANDQLRKFYNWGTAFPDSISAEDVGGIRGSIYGEVVNDINARKQGWDDYYQKFQAQNLFGDDVTHGQFERLMNYNSALTASGADQDQSLRYIEFLRNGWDPTKSDAENAAAADELLRQTTQENALVQTDPETGRKETDKYGFLLEDPFGIGQMADSVDIQNAISNFLNLTGGQTPGDLLIPGAPTGGDSSFVGPVGPPTSADQDAISVLAGTDADKGTVGTTQDILDTIKGADTTTSTAADDALLGLSSAEVGQGEQDAIDQANLDALGDMSSAEVGQGEQDAIDQANLDALLGLSSAEVGKDEQKAVDDALAAINTTTGGGSGGAKISGGASTGTKTPATTPTTTPVTTPVTTPTDTSSGNLLGLLALLGGDQQPAQQKKTVAEEPYVEFDWSKPFQINPFATPTTAPKMYEGGSIDELLELLQRRG